MIKSINPNNPSSNPLKVSNTQNKDNHNLAYLLAIGSGICLVIMQLFLKELTKDLDFLFVLGLRGNLLFLFNLFFLVLAKQAFHSPNP
jgi:drug/metabolite transporter (DMT)-like permease